MFWVVFLKSDASSSLGRSEKMADVEEYAARKRKMYCFCKGGKKENAFVWFVSFLSCLSVKFLFFILGV